MRVLLLGASGATGRLVVRQLLKREINTRVVIRINAELPAETEDNPLLDIVRGSINEFTNLELGNLLEDCDAVISCLGHNTTFKGMFGNPRYLVFDAVQGISEAAKKGGNKKVKLILMSTTAYTNRSRGEINSTGEKLILSLLNLILPPHRDNVSAANYLINEIGQDDEKIEWVAVRPDTLVDAENESAYDLYESSIRSPVFNAGTTSRINVSHFMAELLTNEQLWEKWRYKTPVIYNQQQVD